MDQSLSIIFFFSAILIVGGLLFAFISISRNSLKQLDVDKFRSRWMSIETKLKREDPHTHTICIMEADKLLDYALKERGIQGKTMADRMKQMQGKWSNGNGVWAAHKLRNKLVHEPDARIDYDRARQALAVFKQALKDVGAI